MDGSLPENDGMNSLRQKLQEIRQLAVSTEEKAQRMHYLMMQDYISHKTSLPTPSASPDGRLTNGITRDDMPHLHAPPAIDPDNPYNLRPGDLDPVYSPLPPIRHDDVVIEDDGNDSSSETSSDLLPDLGCMHYKRNVKVQCFDCQQWQQTSAQQSVIGPEFTGEAVLRSAGIGVGEREGMLAVPSDGQGAGQGAASVELLDVPSSPATHPVRSPPHSPGRYFVDASASPPNEPRRSSFTTFSAPSMPNLPTLSSLSASTPGLPRLPRLPNLPHLPNLPDLQAMRGYATLPNVGNFGVGERLGDGWERTYEMMSAVGRSLSPMRYYLNGLDERDRIEAESDGLPDEQKIDGRGLAGFGGSVNSNGGLRAGLERRSSAWSEPGLGWLGRERWTGKQEDGEDGESGSEEDEEEEEVDMLGEEEEEGGKMINPFDELELMGHR
ncbi:hypothetical protein TI39_contig347g00004 [Zymoseptoria brevis]|uniref:Uncharacterized protein n=1 Tax=Zymoseptoria brevis TaxID=1047168 RepID=A0A0F4GR97_9PEZI|nr:hypothetical protein TI39_contig347g00004 [Zymoseptoria brevis]